MSRIPEGQEWRRMDNVPEALTFDSEAGAAAVERAREGIEKHRKGEAEVRLTTADGRPVAGREVQVALVRHAFPFGSNAWALDRMHQYGEFDTDAGRAWRRRFAELFNAANCMCYWTERPSCDGPKTEDVLGEPRLDGFHRVTEWATSEGMLVRGHPLCWSIPKCTPDWVMRHDLATQLKFLEVRIRSLVAGGRGRLTMWDAVNEALWEPAWKHLPQRRWPHIDPIPDLVEYIAPVIEWARDEDPDSRYVVNDYGLVGEREVEAEDGTIVTSAMQRKRMLELVEALTEADAPPDSIGLQSHVGGWIEPDLQMAIYDELAEAGVPLQVTEFTAHTRHAGLGEDATEEHLAAAQADYVEKHLTCAFGHPAIEAFFFWGFTNWGLEWSRRAGRRAGHTRRPVWDRVRELIRDRWTTRLTATTDAEGRFRFRGFYGDYAVRYSVGGRVKVGLSMRLGREQAGPITLVAGRGV